MAATCNLPDCDKPKSGRCQLCSMHYSRRRRHGRVDAQHGNHATLLNHLDRPLSDFDDACILWPGHARNGYGIIGLSDGASLRIHVVTCEHFHGPNPNGLLCLHSRVDGTPCVNSTCFNPRHLRWGTAQDNMDDRTAHGHGCAGSRNPNAKLTEEAVIAIRRRRAGGEKGTDLAAEYGVTPAAISKINRHKNWLAANHRAMGGGPGS